MQARTLTPRCLVLGQRSVPARAAVFPASPQGRGPLRQSTAWQQRLLLRKSLHLVGAARRHLHNRLSARLPWSAVCCAACATKPAERGGKSETVSGTAHVDSGDSLGMMDADVLAYFRLLDSQTSTSMIGQSSSKTASHSVDNSTHAASSGIAPALGIQ